MGNFSASYTLNFSDVDLPGTGPLDPLTLLLTAIVESDPAEFGAAASGDFDQDAGVDGIDFLAWQRNLGTTNAELWQGDGNGDTVVDASDLAVWGEQFGTTVTAQTASVPEPATLSLVALALVALGGLPGLRRRDP